MPAKTRQRFLSLLLLTLVAGLLSGCTLITVQNVHTEGVYVVVRPPDSNSSSMYKLAPGAAGMVDSLFGGSFQVDVLPDMSVLNALQDQRELIEARIMVENLTVDQVKNGQKEILRLQNMIQEQKAQVQSKIGSCSGNVLDFGKVGAVVDITNNGYGTVTCKVENPKYDDLDKTIQDLIITFLGNY